MGSIANIALDGISRASQTIVESAERVTSDDELGEPAAIISLKQGEQAFRASAQLIKVDQALSKSIIDIFA